MQPTRSPCLPIDPWLTGKLGKNVFRLAAEDGCPGDGELDAAAAGECLIYAKVAVEDLEAVQWLEARGFRIVDTNITLERLIENFPAVSLSSGVNIRQARPEDADAVADLAGRAFTWSRFHKDPLVPDETANRIKADWARNFFDGGRGDAMVVAERAGRIVGFNQLLCPREDLLVIDLIGVDTASRGKGIGGGLVREAAALAPRNGTLRVGTQLANTGSLRFYQDYGFAVVAASYVLHRHGGKAKT